MQLAERHIIKNTHKHYQEIDQLCFFSKNLYNIANYLIRQSFFKTGEILNYNQTQKLLQSQFDYKNLPAKVSQQILMILDKNWKSFFQAQKAYQENPSKFLGRPKLPKYKHKEKGRNLLVYTIQALSKPFLAKGLIKLSQTEIVFPTQAKKIAQVRIIPKLNHYVIKRLPRNKLS